MRPIKVDADALARILSEIDPGGFLSRDLGVRYADDGTGVMRRLVPVFDAAARQEEPS